MECDFIEDVSFRWLLVYLLMTGNKAIYRRRQQGKATVSQMWPVSHGQRLSKTAFLPEDPPHVYRS